MQTETRFQLEKLFPKRIHEVLKEQPRRSLPAAQAESQKQVDWQAGLEEIRVRIGQPIEFAYDTGRRYLARSEEQNIFLDETEIFQYQRSNGQKDTVLYRTDRADIAEMLNYISHYSLYAYKEELRQGYITVEGGHRVGIAGCAVLEGGKIVSLSPVTFLNIRVAHEKSGCAEAVLPYIRQGNSIHNTLFLSAPGVGKTTYLRDSIRMLSAGSIEHPGMKVCVVDERSEIAACYMGIPQNDMGPRTDVLDGCSKSEGMLMLLRSMSPQVLAVDELGAEKDFMAVEQAVYSGSRVLGTIHAGDIRELSGKPFLRRWMGKELFHRYVQIDRGERGERTLHIYDEHMERLC